METRATKLWQRGILVLLLWLACGLPDAFAVELGQISGTDKYAWSETSGWLNFKPTNGGVTVHAQYLSGYAWAANVGWVKLGADGGGPYANTDSTNWGVNRDAAGALSGYAWGENVGWINFDHDHDQGQVTIDPVSGDFDGYAWSANLGYIHFQNAESAYKVQSSAVVASNPGAPIVPKNDADGAYTVKWTASSSAGVSYVLQEATNNNFTGARTAYTGSALSVNISGRATNKTYYYQVKAIKSSFTDSGWRKAANGCLVKFQAKAPAWIKVSAADPDGKYQVKWGKSGTAGVRYVLQEATNYTFTQGVRTLPGTTALLATITRPVNKTYYYRVKAIKTGYTDSAWKAGLYGCAVPGKATVATPGLISKTSVYPVGRYTVKWNPSATAGVTYVLEEARNSGFTVGLRTAYAGPAKLCKITGRTKNVTYYYRVRAIKAGFRDSAWRKGSWKCTK